VNHIGQSIFLSCLSLCLSCHSPNTSKKPRIADRNLSPINRNSIALAIPNPINQSFSRSSPILFFFMSVSIVIVFGMLQLQTSFEFVTYLTTYLLLKITHSIIPINTVFNTVNPTNHRTMFIRISTVLGLSSVHTLGLLSNPIMRTPRLTHTRIQSLFRILHSP